MKFRFIGKYTNRHASINAGGVVFEGHEAAQVTCPELQRRLSANPEFEAVEAHPLDHDADGVKGGSLPKKRGRPKKVAE